MVKLRKINIFDYYFCEFLCVGNKYDNLCKGCPFYLGK